VAARFRSLENIECSLRVDAKPGSTRFRAADSCRPYRRRFVPFACALPYAAERRARRMRPAGLPPRPLAGYRRKQSSIDGDPSFSIHLSLCSTRFHRLLRSYEEVRLLHGHRPVVVASFRPNARTPSLTRDGVPFADPCRPPRAIRVDVMPLPAPIRLRSRLDFGRRVPWHAHPIGPACTGLHTYVRCCSAPPASSPHGLTAPGRIVSRPPAQLPSACGCFQLAPQRTCTSNPGSMPGTPRRACGPRLRRPKALTGLAAGPSLATSVRRWGPADAGAHHTSTLTEASYTKYLTFPLAASISVRPAFANSLISRSCRVANICSLRPRACGE
jgi:hypothetical protein